MKHATLNYAVKTNYKLTLKGENFAEEIMHDHTILLFEKSILKQISSSSVGENKIRDLFGSR